MVTYLNIPKTWMDIGVYLESFFQPAEVNIHSPFSFVLVSTLYLPCFEAFEDNFNK